MRKFKLLGAFSITSSIYFAWLSYHYWTRSIQIQNSFFPTWKIHTITWLQEMGVVCSVFSILLAMIFVLTYGE